MGAVMGKERLVPELRFPEFKSDWKKKNLLSITKYTKGFAFKSKDYKEEGIRIIRVSDLGVDTIKFNNTQLFIDPAKARNYQKYELIKGNIIITTVGSKPELKESAVGRGIYVNVDGLGLLNQNLLKFENIEGVNNRFIFSYINTPRYTYFISSISRGNANQSNITVKELLQYRVFLPDLEEQQKIANFLTAIDQRITLLKHKKDALEQYKKGLMQKIFNQEIRFKDEDGNDYPDWEEKRFSDVFDRVTRKNKEDNQNVMTISAQDGLINQLEYYNHSVSAKDVTNYFLLKKGEFAYNKSYSKGYPMGAIKKLKRYKKGVVSSLYICFSAKNTDSSEFFEHYFESGKFNRQIYRIAQEGARNHGLLNMSVVEFFRDLALIVPSIEEQQKIANFLTAIDQSINQLTNQIYQTTKFKKGLLQRMFV